MCGLELNIDPVFFIDSYVSNQQTLALNFIEVYFKIENLNIDNKIIIEEEKLS